MSGVSRWSVPFLGALVASLVLLGACAGPGPERDSAPPLSSIPDQTAPSGPAPSQTARPCTSDRKSCREQFALSEGGKLPVYRNFSLSGNDAVTSAIVVVHGTGRNAGGYFTRMLEAAKLAGASDTTLVAAPWFTTGDDDGTPRGTVRWTSDGWKIGENSRKPGGISSFTAMDELLLRLGDRSKFPHLTRITVAGHSAGGQFTQRYAATGKAQAQLTGIAVNYVVANPSSYLYPVPERPGAGGTHFARPNDSSCENYNEYKYGLQNAPSYLAGMNAQQVANNLATRRITYLLGASDTEQDDELDTDCAAGLEGENRFQRGTYFYNWIRQTFPSAPTDRVVVPGTAHESDEMFQSSQARPALFGKT
ncbi:MAG TPA: alpha/beta hydrolase [Pseudonocardia sp.]|jgi:pimeloyl-ACP methyl ester carboxylesterase|nr:alpha/beta hydrolase [Pseudonocardia sp.]